jgi:hypothetical protein
MPDIGTEITPLKDAARLRRWKPQRPRLGKTWQDRAWRQELTAQGLPSTFRAGGTARATNRRALLSRHASP